MLNVIELENRWRKYKVKSFIPYISILFIMIFVFILIVLFIQPQKSKELHNIKVVKKDEIKVVKKPTVHIQKKDLKLIVATQEEKKQDVKSKQNLKKIVLSPSLNFISDIQFSSNYQTDKKKEVKKYSQTTVKSNEIKVIEKKLKTKQKTLVTKEIKKPVVLATKVHATSIIKRETTKKDINDVLKRFQKNNNPALSLFVAKKYYELGDYRQAYNYALITNGISDTIETSWIIFAKSLVKLNKKDEAIKTLEKYVSHTHSDKARRLLENIISGKFR